MEATETVTTERLYDLRREVEKADDAWFDALVSGADGAAEKAARTEAMETYREYERAVMDARLTETCWKCGGSKVVNYGRVYLDKRYVNREGATTRVVSERWCFACGGTGSQYVHKHRFTAQASTRYKKKLAREAEDARKAAEDRERWDAFAAEHTEVAEYLAAAEGDDFLSSLKGAAERFGSLTEKQMAAVERNMARDKAEREREAKLAAGAEFPADGETVTGEVVSYKSYPGYAGGTEFKMVVLLDSGFKVFGRVPEALWRAAGDLTDEARERGEDLHYSPDDFRVSFSAKFTRSEDDPGFGYFKSPRGVKSLGLKEAT